MTFEITKDPASKEDYSIDYSSMLAQSSPGDVIIQSAWSTSTTPDNTDLTIHTDTNRFLLPGSFYFLLPDGSSHLIIPGVYITGGSVTTVWVSGGGKLNTKHRLLNRVTTAGGRQWDRTIEVTMEAD